MLLRMFSIGHKTFLYPAGEKSSYHKHKGSDCMINLLLSLLTIRKLQGFDYFRRKPLRTSNDWKKNLILRIFLH